MAFIKNSERKCIICGHDYHYQQLLENTSFGMRDLDTRPPGMLRRMMHLTLQKCPNCGYVNNDVSIRIKDFDESILKSEEYLEILNDEKINFAIKKFKLYGFIMKDIDNQKAGMAYLRAAWMADDAKCEKEARMLRSKAIKYLEASLKTNENENVKLILVDLYRRVGLFEEAHEYAMFLLNNLGLEKYKRNILFYQLKLCEDEDILDHTMPGNHNFYLNKDEEDDE